MQYKQYFIGDSHFTDFYSMYSEKFPELEWKTILSPGFQRIVRDNARTGISDSDIEYIWQVFEKLEKKSRIFLSCTDVDSRIGAFGFEAFLKEDYHFLFKKISQITETNELIVLDWYSIKNEHVAMQTTTPLKRASIRGEIINILQELKLEKIIKNYHTTFMNDEFDDESGICKDPSLIRDGVHYDFSHEKIKKLLLPTLRTFIEEAGSNE